MQYGINFSLMNKTSFPFGNLFDIGGNLFGISLIRKYYIDPDDVVLTKCFFLLFISNNNKALTFVLFFHWISPTGPIQSKGHHLRLCVCLCHWVKSRDLVSPVCGIFFLQSLLPPASYPDRQCILLHSAQLCDSTKWHQSSDSWPERELPVTVDDCHSLSQHCDKGLFTSLYSIDSNYLHWQGLWSKRLHKFL
jgi:hypothetical protein